MNTLTIYIENDHLDNQYMGNQKSFTLNCLFGTEIDSSFILNFPFSKNPMPKTYTLWCGDNETKVPLKNFQFYYLLTSIETIEFLKEFQRRQKLHPQTPPKEKVPRQAFYRLKKDRESFIKGLIAFLKHTKRDVIIEALS